MISLKIFRLIIKNIKRIEITHPIDLKITITSQNKSKKMSCSRLKRQMLRREVCRGLRKRSSTRPLSTLRTKTRPRKSTRSSITLQWNENKSMLIHLPRRVIQHPNLPLLRGSKPPFTPISQIKNYHLWKIPKDNYFAAILKKNRLLTNPSTSHRRRKLTSRRLQSLKSKRWQRRGQSKKRQAHNLRMCKLKKQIANKAAKLNSTYHLSSNPKE